MMLLMNQRTAKAAVVMKRGCPSNADTVKSAVAQRMAFAIMMAGSCLLRRFRLVVDVE